MTETTRRYLIVGNQTLGGDHLAEQVRECQSQGPSSFHLLVPATPPSHYLVWTEDEAMMLARRRLARGVAQLRELGVEVTGEVGDANPLKAMGDVLAHQPFDEIILFTLRPGLSRWLQKDLPRRAVRRFAVPITHVVAPLEPIASAEALRARRAG